MNYAFWRKINPTLFYRWGGAEALKLLLIPYSNLVFTSIVCF